MIISYSSNEHHSHGELDKAETNCDREPAEPMLNPKGGVGKSTLAVNLERGLQMAECDPEGRALRRRFQHRIDGSK